MIRGIPRFVESEEYTSSFGLQWNKFRMTQLDSHTHQNISQDRLQRIVGGDLNLFKGKTVLEAGCGAGRFTEIMLRHGANVYAIDLSEAVEANRKNCKEYKNYLCAQADILKLPFHRNYFDIVICIGVLQHTPSPELSMSVLCSHLKPGGFLFIDHYSHEYPETWIRKIIRLYLTSKEKKYSLKYCCFLTKLLWPTHKTLWKLRDSFLGNKMYALFTHISPIVDYQGSYPELSENQMFSWACLDTHDTLTDRYKHLRNGKEIFDHLARCGMTDIEWKSGGNGIEVSAKKSISPRVS